MSTRPQLGTQLGTSSTDVVTLLPFSSHASHIGHLRRSAVFEGYFALHTWWTTLGAERHVDLWMTDRAVHTLSGRLPALLHRSSSTWSPAGVPKREERSRCERPDRVVAPAATDTS